MRRVLPTDFDIVRSFQVFPYGRVEDKSLGDKNVQYEFVSLKTVMWPVSFI